MVTIMAMVAVIRMIQIKGKTMWPFKKRYLLQESGILQGRTDWHSHILPGVDDGVQTVEEALQILAEYERLGIREVWLTPHIMEDIPNTTALLRERFIELQALYIGPIILHLAAENMLDNLFEERLEKKDLLPLGENGDHLLVETSYFSPPIGLSNILFRIKAKGLSSCPCPSGTVCLYGRIRVLPTKRAKREIPAQSLFIEWCIRCEDKEESRMVDEKRLLRSARK